MSIKVRRRDSFKKKNYYIFLLLLLAVLFFIIYLIFLTRSPLFISPLGKNNSDMGRVEKILRDNNILFSQVVVLSDSSYGIKIPNNGEIRLSSQKNIGKQIASLQRILRELTIEGKSFKSIDFRFVEPIISF